MLAEHLNVVAPEVVLAVFAMASLLWGAYAGREVGGPVLWASLRAAGRGRALGRVPAGGRAGGVRRVVRQRRLRAFRQGDDPVRRRGGAGAQPRLPGEGGADEVRVPGADRALGGRHDDHGLGARPDRALHGAGAAEPVALRRRRLPAGLPALDRGGAEVLRAGGAVVGAAALRREPDLRLSRAPRPSPGSPRSSARGRCRSGWCSGWCSSAPASPSRCRRCRSTCGRPTSTRARRRR